MAGLPKRSPRVVLIVEDEPLLRMFAVEVVEAGFVAIEAGDADEPAPPSFLEQLLCGQAVWPAAMVQDLRSIVGSA